MQNIRIILNKLLNFLASVTFAAMVLLTCWQVFTRYTLKNPSSWTEELVSYLFAWMALLGACVVTGEMGHMNIPLLVDRLKDRGQRCLNIISQVVALVFSAVVLVYGGVRITTLALGQMTSALGVPVGIFYTVLPLCGGLNMVYSLLNIWELLSYREVS